MLTWQKIAVVSILQNFATDEPPVQLSDNAPLCVFVYGQILPDKSFIKT